MNDIAIPDTDTAATILQAALEQINWARNYTLELLDATPHDRWFAMPDGLPTHIAWQVGHLAYSQYGLCMFRMRGRKPEDLELIPGPFRKTYARSSRPNPDAAAQPTPQQLLERLGEVHRISIAELESISDSNLNRIDSLLGQVAPDHYGEAILLNPAITIGLEKNRQLQAISPIVIRSRRSQDTTESPQFRYDTGWILLTNEALETE